MTRSTKVDVAMLLFGVVACMAFGTSASLSSHLARASVPIF